MLRSMDTRVCRFQPVGGGTSGLPKRPGPAAGSGAANQPSPSIVTLSFNNAVLGTAEAQRDLSALQKEILASGAATSEAE